MKTQVRLLWIVPLLFAVGACGLFTRYRLVSEEYSFSVEFPEKPIEQSSRNYQGLPKSLWTVESDSSKEFFSAEATSYKEPLNPAPNWIPNREALSSVEIQITESRRFKLRSAATGREVLAIATTAKQALTGATLSSIYVVDGRTLISITARTTNDGRRAAFLESLTLLR
jgi:hypothetical protein